MHTICMRRLSFSLVKPQFDPLNSQFGCAVKKQE